MAGDSVDRVQEYSQIFKKAFTTIVQIPMGMYNSIIAELRCSVTGKNTPNIEIQIKWQPQKERLMHQYHLGDTIAGLAEKARDTWICKGYVCQPFENLMEYPTKTHSIKSDSYCSGDHLVYIRMTKEKITETLTATEFNLRESPSF